MKFKLPIFICLFSFSICNAQVAPPLPGNGKPKVFTEVEQMPDFPGGTSELLKFIKANTKLPEYVTKNNVEGKVFVKFIVNVDGTLSDPSIILPFDGCKECDDEAIRLIKSMPNWKPGMQNGKAVPVSFNLPIKFKK